MILPTYAISVRQPWAWLIVHGWKPVENRSRGTSFRGETLIHASKTFDEYAFETIWRISENAYRAMPQSIDAFQTGGIVGQARVVDCVDYHASPWFFGPKGIVLTGQKPLPFTPCRGNQILFFKHGLTDLAA